MTEGRATLSKRLSETAEEAEARERSFESDLRDLASHARDYARTEFAFQRTRVAYAGKAGLAIAVLFGAAIVLLLLAVMGLVFGLILALTPLVTAWGAIAIVCLFLLAVAAACFVAALSRWRAVTHLFDGDDAE
jgi:hypothetical protein